MTRATEETEAGGDCEIVSMSVDCCIHSNDGRPERSHCDSDQQRLPQRLVLGSPQGSRCPRGWCRGLPRGPGAEGLSQMREQQAPSLAGVTADVGGPQLWEVAGTGLWDEVRTHVPELSCSREFSSCPGRSFER